VRFVVLVGDTPGLLDPHHGRLDDGLDRSADVEPGARIRTMNEYGNFISVNFFRRCHQPRTGCVAIT